MTSSSFRDRSGLANDKMLDERDFFTAEIPLEFRHAFGASENDVLKEFRGKGFHRCMGTSGGAKGTEELSDGLL